MRIWPRSSYLSLTFSVAHAASDRNAQGEFATEDDMQHSYWGAVAGGILAQLSLSWHLTNAWNDGVEFGETGAAALMVSLMLGRW